MKGRLTLDNIIRGYLISQEKPTLHGYLRLMKIMVDFLRKFAMNHSIMDKTVILKLDQKKSVAFPDDCVMPRMVSWQSGDRIVGFQIDSRVALKHSYCDDGVSATPNASFDPHQQWPYNGVGQMNNLTLEDGRVVSCGVNIIGYNGLGYFRVNWQCREIQFSTDTPSDFKIYLEYRTNGFSPKSKSTIPEFAAKLGEDYLHWKNAEKRFGAASAEANARKSVYDEEYDEVLKYMDGLNYENILGAKSRSFDLNKLAG
jgi:hypothetical protein